MMERKLSKYGQMRVGNIEPVRSLIRQDRKDLIHIRIELADFSALTDLLSAGGE